MEIRFTQIFKVEDEIWRSSSFWVWGVCVCEWLGEGGEVEVLCSHCETLTIAKYFPISDQVLSAYTVFMLALVSVCFGNCISFSFV